jgi:carbon-monoxide dehydrogenase small subunit
MTARTINFTLNGRAVTTSVTPDDNIVDMLSRQFDLRGARESCGQGLCGCCTVHVNSKAVSGCLSFAWFLDGATVETIEGLGTGEKLDPIQEAFNF